MKSSAVFDAVWCLNPRLFGPGVVADRHLSGNMQGLSRIQGETSAENKSQTEAVMD